MRKEKSHAERSYSTQSEKGENEKSEPLQPPHLQIMFNDRESQASGGFKNEADDTEYVKIEDLKNGQERGIKYRIV
jgi:hypothetical protein